MTMRPPKKLIVQRMGDALGVVLPPEIAERLRIGEGDVLYAGEADGGMLLTTRDPSLDRAMAMYRRGAEKYSGALGELGRT